MMKKSLMDKIDIKKEVNLVNKLKDGSGGLLSRKEAVVASYLVEDYTVDDIADLLCRSRNTIKTHIKNLKRKCRCETGTRLGVILQVFIKNNPQDNNITDNGL